MFELVLPKMSLTNLVNGETLPAQYNPEQLEEEIGANYAKLAVLGLSHQVKQFAHTDDLTFAFTLHWRATRGPAGMQELLRARRFMHAACAPVGVAGSIRKAGPPRILFVWPGLISLTSVVTKARVVLDSFNKTLLPGHLSMAVTLEEVRDVNITSEEVFAVGTERSGIRPEGT